MFKNQKGITLIALVITIIVLLILAGVTIAMLSGSDSTPAKANEGAIKDALAGGKDAVSMKVVDLLQDYYTTTYVNAAGTGDSSALTTILNALDGTNKVTANNVKIVVDKSKTGADENNVTITYQKDGTDTNYTVAGKISGNGGITWGAYQGFSN